MLSESLSTAFLVMLERLNPVERAIFLLHDIFEYDYTEIAPIVGKNEANCRQIGRRARDHVHAHRPRFEPSAEKRDHLLQQFLHAVSDGDVPSLVGLLADEITLWTDGGGKVAAARRPIQGATAVARLIAGLSQHALAGATVAPALLNGQPGLLVYADDTLLAAMVLQIAGERIQGIYVVANPDKLQRVMQHSPNL
jgi:RNA polymerase sigma-70 factor (ECF subfamily)